MCISSNSLHTFYVIISCGTVEYSSGGKGFKLSSFLRYNNSRATFCLISKDQNIYLTRPFGRPLSRHVYFIPESFLKQNGSIINKYKI